MVQNRRGAKNGMAREWQFLEEIEDAGADGAGLRGRLQKYCLEVPQFLGDTQHLPGAQSARVREDGEAVARIGGWAEYINMKVFERHLPSSRACNCSVKSQFFRVFAGERREARYGRLPDDVGKRSEERRVGKSVDLGGRRIFQK